jgi:uncharacterized protein YdgA (DUF945 family)
LLGALAGANAEVSIAKELLEAGWANMLKNQLRTTLTAQGKQADEAMLENIAKTQVQQQLAQLVKSDFIRLDGKTYKAKARFQDKRLFLNDKEIPLVAP